VIYFPATLFLVQKGIKKYIYGVLRKAHDAQILYDLGKHEPVGYTVEAPLLLLLGEIATVH
jgi:hypothetical protein